MLHHFGSREELVDAVAQARGAAPRARAARLPVSNVQVDVDSARDTTTHILERIDEVLRVHGHARLLAWLALNGFKAAPRESMLRELAVAVHALGKAHGGTRPLEDAQFGVLLTSAAMFGVALVGTELFAMLGLPADEAMHAKFREWLATTLLARGTAA